MLVTPPSGEVWQQFDALDSRPEYTDITFAILDTAGNALLSDVTSGTNIASLGSQTIQLRAVMETTDPAETPLLHSWSLTSGTPTAVTVSSFITRDSSGSVLLDWETASEVDLVGFELYRSETFAGEKQKLNANLLPAQHPGQAQGANYRFIDVVGQGHRFFYWLEVVQIDGMVVIGPVEVYTYYRIRMPLMRGN
jgi:hypothetical protein